MGSKWKQNRLERLRKEEKFKEGANDLLRIDYSPLPQNVISVSKTNAVESIVEDMDDITTAIKTGNSVNSSQEVSDDHILRDYDIIPVATHPKSTIQVKEDRNEAWGKQSGKEGEEIGLWRKAGL